MTASAILACPHCAAPLALDERVAVCQAGHSFDRARQGYLNLLVGGRLAPSSVPGDTPDALAARRRFFAGGHYVPIADAVADAVASHDVFAAHDGRAVPGGLAAAAAGAADAVIADGGAARDGVEGIVLDIGCGEGFYLSRIAASHRAGLDISKTAVRMSSTLLPDVLFFVASSYRMPVLPESVDVVVSVFAPRPISEVARVLRPGGRFVSVAPAAGHLAELAPAGETADRRDRAERRDAPPSPDAHRLTFPLDLTGEAIADLVQMTPLAWHTHAHDVVAAGVRTATVDVWVSNVRRAELA